MIRLLLYVHLLIFFGSCSLSKKTGNSGSFRMPGEWEEHEAVWVGILRPSGNDTASAAIIKAIYKNVQVKILYDNDGMLHSFNRFLHTQQVDTTQLHWVRDSIRTTWMRDPGPLFLVNKKGERKVIDFNWNEYGHCFVYNYQLRFSDAIIGRIDKRIASYLQLPVVSTSIVAEGGGIETNGEGVLMSTEETALQRNPGKSLSEIEAEYLRVTNCKKMIWLKRMTLHDKAVPGLSAGNWVGGGANGHIDEVARFINPHTIALAKIDEEERWNNPISAADYTILEECYDILKKAVDVKGRPFTIIRFPYPDLNVHGISNIVTDGLRQQFTDKNINLKNGDTVWRAPAVSYMNFMVTNGVVLSAAYWKKGMPLREKEKDDEVKVLLGQLYPGRQVIQINPLSINLFGGGMHCVTQQQPKAIKR